VQSKEGWSVELKIIATHSLGDSVRTIENWEEFLMGSCKTLFLQMYLDLVSNLKLVWHPVLIMALLVLSIDFLQNLIDLLANVLNLLNESGGFFSLRLNMGRVWPCGCRG
jgi:hypothetical protein